MFLKTVNWPILIGISLLLSIGILVIFSSVIFSSSQIIAFQQLIYALVGLLLFFFLSSIDYRIWGNLTKPALFFILFLLVVVFIIGFETRGSVRWIPLGFLNVQPSEFAKPVLIVFLAYFWSKRVPTWKNIGISLLWTAPLLILIFRQPDLGTTLTVASIWFITLLTSRISLKKVILILLLVALIIPAGWFTLQDYQKQRIFTFLSPGADPLNQGYNTIQSTIAVGSGHIWGRGLGQGTQSRLQFLPEYRTDFIFAAIAEELGFLGSILIIGIYLFLVVYCFKIAGEVPDYFGSMIASGTAGMILFQSVVNIGMNIGLLPVTGITLPLLSYGGSSLIATLISLGLVSSVAKSRRER
jgi:rod shape determining protein RodA